MPDWNSWLTDPAARRVLLLVVEASGSAPAYYWASEDYRTASTDSLPDTLFQGRIGNDPQIKAEVKSPLIGRPRAVSTVGAVELINLDGALSPLLLEAWAGRDAQLLLGDASWSYDDFQPIFTGLADALEAPATGRIKLTMVDKTKKLDITFPVHRYTADDDSPAAPDAIGELKPWSEGAIRNMEPVLVDESGPTYDFDGYNTTAGIHNVYDRGLRIAQNAGGDFYTLAANPDGRITGDYGLFELAGISIVLRRLLTNALGTTDDDNEDAGPLTDAEYDFDGWDAVRLAQDADWGTWNVPCFYAKDETNLLETIDSIVQSVGAISWFDRTGRFTGRRVESPSGTAVLNVTDDQRLSSIDVSVASEARRRIDIRFKSNWTVQDEDAVAGAIGEARLAQITRDGQIVSAGDLSAPAADSTRLLLSWESDAQREADRWHEILSQTRWLARATYAGLAFRVDLGDELLLRSDELDALHLGALEFSDGDPIEDENGEALEAGRHAIVMGRRERPLSGESELTLWF